MAPRGWGTRLVLAVFLVSGATSLVYEVIWARQLQLVFGTSQVAISTVLAAFMAGLAAGAFTGARWTPAVRRPLLVYAALEAFIGLYAVAFPWLLAAVTPLYLGFWRAVEPGPTSFAAFQLVLVGMLLLPPTVCMGATLPLLVGYVRATANEAGVRVGHLYGANTFGAVLGTALAGFVLLPKLGLSATTHAAVVANGSLALAALALGALFPTAARVGSPIAPAPDVRERPRRLLLVAALEGFSSLLLEVAWFRLMTLVFGGSAYAFSIMLVAFLVGIGLGGWGGGARADRSYQRGGHARVLLVVAGLQTGIAVLSWAAMYLYAELPVAMVELYDLLHGAPRWLFAAELGLALALMLPAALLMGATFPYLVRAAAGDGYLDGRPVGELYGANTLGAIAGAAGGGLVLLPALTIRGAVLAAASVNVIAALLAAVVGGALRGRRLALATAVAAAAIGLAHWRKPPWNALLMNSGPYVYAPNLGELSRRGLYDFAVEPFKLLFYEEGLSSVVTVGGDEQNIWLANNGKVDASLGDLHTQVLLAHLPLAFHPDAHRLLVIGFASGMTTGSMALHEAPSHIDVVEIEPAVIRASHQFDEYNERPLEDPRVHLHLNDARNHLLLTPDGTYDVVSCEPSNPWLSGVSHLFTREFFVLGKRKMAAGGVWAQWVQTYGFRPDDLRSLLATFADVYATVLVFRIDVNDLVLIGSDRPLSLAPADLWTIASRSSAVTEDLKVVDVERGEDLLAAHLFGRDRIVELAGDIERNTDDNMRIEYAAPLALHAATLEENGALLEGAAVAAVDAVSGKEGLLALARAYAQRDDGGRRAVSTVEDAFARYSGDDVLAVYNEIQKTVAQRRRE
jgi:spermidine synthase